MARTNMDELDARTNFMIYGMVFFHSAISFSLSSESVYYHRLELRRFMTEDLRPT